MIARVARVALTALLLGACGGSQVQARAASAIAHASNAALDQAVAAYQAEGLYAVDAASSGADAVAAVTIIRARWRPAWDAWEVYRLAFRTWSAAIARDDAKATAAAVDAMHAGYCGFRRALTGKLGAQLAALGCDP